MEDRFAVAALMKKGGALVFLLIGLAVAVAATPGQISAPPVKWIDAGAELVLPRAMSFENASGSLGILNADGPVETKGHAFFQPLGANGRACVTCHQPANAMSLSVDAIRERWHTTKGKDPLFAWVRSDGPSDSTLYFDFDNDFLSLHTTTAIQKPGGSTP
jgi:hypothetical protein